MPNSPWGRKIMIAMMRAPASTNRNPATAAPPAEPPNKSGEGVGLGQNGPEDHRAGDRPGVAAGTADEEDGPDEECDEGQERVRPDRPEAESEHGAGQSADRPSDHQALALVGHDVLAKGASRLLVLADRFEDPSHGEFNR